MKSLKRVSVTNGVFTAIVKFYGGYYRINGSFMILSNKLSNTGTNCHDDQ